MKLGNAALAILVATSAPGQLTRELPPPPPTLRLTKAEDDALRPLIGVWNAQRRVKKSPIVVIVESLPYLPEIEPYLRLELLRRDVPAATTEALLTALRERNALSWSIEASAFQGATRLRAIDILLKGLDPKSASDPTLQNAADLRAITVPGVAEDSAIIFYASGPQMMNTLYDSSRLAFVRHGKLLWEHEFGKHDLLGRRGAPPPPHEAPLTADDLAVIEALLDRRFPDRAKAPLVVNQTHRYDIGDQNATRPSAFDAALAARNDFPLFIREIDVGRRVTMVRRERLRALREDDLAGAPGIIELSLPAYSADRQNASIAYIVVAPRDGGLEMGTAIAVATRGQGVWTVVSDDYRWWSRPGAKIDPNVVVRVGGDVKAPIAIKPVEPQFPPGTRAGVMILELTIDRQGHVTSANVLTPRGPAADQSAIDAVRQWQFQPGTLNGQPIAVIYNVTVRVP